VWRGGIPCKIIVLATAAAPEILIESLLRTLLLSPPDPTEGAHWRRGPPDRLACGKPLGRFSRPPTGIPQREDLPKLVQRSERRRPRRRHLRALGAERLHAGMDREPLRRSDPCRCEGHHRL